MSDGVINKLCEETDIRFITPFDVFIVMCVFKNIARAETIECA